MGQKLFGRHVGDGAGDGVVAECVGISSGEGRNSKVHHFHGTID